MKITTLIPTSPIPSHPSTEVLDETIAHIRNYTKDRIIIMFDGVHRTLSHRTEDYEQYRKDVLDNATRGKYGECFCKDFEWHTHQAEMMRLILKEGVDTDLVFFVEHDCYIKGDIPFKEICHLVKKSGDINYVRFNIFEQIPEEHEYLMLSKISLPLPLTRTIQFSARPHIAKTKWYQSILFDYFPQGSKEMIEDRLHGVVISKYDTLGFDTFGLAIYTPEGSQLRSFTSDGRKDDPKITTG